MNTTKNYSLWQIVRFSRNQLIWITVLSFLSVILFELEIHHLSVPWLPVASLGTAAAFLISFKNSASYDRLWESRKIWDSIEGRSRSLFLYIRPYIRINSSSDVSYSEILDQIQKYHFAWLHALRLQLRDPRPWEHYDRMAIAFRKRLNVQNSTHMAEVLSQYLTDEELQEVLKANNRAVRLIEMQIDYFTKMKNAGNVDEVRYNDIIKIFLELNDLQAKTERTKNFPYPRQYASVNYYFVTLFIILVPFGMVTEFSKLDDEFIWVSVPFSIMVSWVFKMLQMVSDYSENPYEGLFNDIPLNRICNRIESDINGILNKKSTPYSFDSENEMGVVV